MTTRRAAISIALLAAFCGSSRSQEVTPMVTVPAGKYLRCSTCLTSRQVEIDTPAFRIDQDEVTQRQYAECVKAKRCAPPKVQPKQTQWDTPMRGVTWSDADAYCKFVGKRLPTEAEWERAAYPQRPGEKEGGPRIGGREPCKALLIGGYGGKRCRGGPYGRPNEVEIKARAAGQKEGLDDRVIADGAPVVYDMYGNVAEWVADWDALPGNPEYYFKPRTRSNPPGPSGGTEHIIRGGSFAALEGSGEGERRRAKPADRLPDVGFRCAAAP